MKAAWAAIESLIAMNALHRKGFRLGEVLPTFVLNQAQEELNELRDSPSDIGELADLLGILFHYAIKKGWTMDALETAMLRKFAARFQTEGPDQ